MVASIRFDVLLSLCRCFNRKFEFFVNFVFVRITSNDVKKFCHSVILPNFLDSGLLLRGTNWVLTHEIDLYSFDIKSRDVMTLNYLSNWESAFFEIRYNYNFSYIRYIYPLNSSYVFGNTFYERIAMWKTETLKYCFQVFNLNNS